MNNQSAEYIIMNFVAIYSKIVLSCVTIATILFVPFGLHVNDAVPILGGLIVVAMISMLTLTYVNQWEWKQYYKQQELYEDRMWKSQQEQAMQRATLYDNIIEQYNQLSEKYNNLSNGGLQASPVY